MLCEILAYAYRRLDHRKVNRCFLLFCWAVALSMLTTLSCTEPNPAGVDENPQVNPSLHRLLYWGAVDALNWAPNAGYPVADLLFPTWVGPSQICVFGRTKTNGTSVRGIIRATFDPSSLEVTNHEVFEFDYTVVSLAFHPPREELIVVFANASGELEAKYASLENGKVNLGEAAVPIGWNPIGIYVPYTTQDVYFYGHRPTDQQAGFYRYTGSAATTVHSVELNPVHARSAAISLDGQTLYYGVVSGPSYAAKTQLFAVSTSTGVPTLVGERNGAFVSVAAHPSDLSLLLFGYNTEGPNEPFENHVELVKIGDPSVVTELDVNTRPQALIFATSEWIGWNANGQSFLFSASAVTSEGGRAVFEVWTYSFD